MRRLLTYVPDEGIIFTQLYIKDKIKYHDSIRTNCFAVTKFHKDRPKILDRSQISK